MDTPQEIYDSFLKEWPVSRLQQMQIDEYTNLDKTSFCYWLEAITQPLGSIWGGSSYKFGIYKRRNTDKELARNGYLSDGEYSWLVKYGNTRDEAFIKLRSIIVSVATAAEQGRFSEIDTMDLGFAYKWKIAFLYSKLQLINLFNVNAVKKVAAHFNHQETVKTAASVLNVFIKQQQQAGEDAWAFGKRIWEIFVDNSGVKGAPRNFYKYSPGINATRWEEDQQLGSIAINFSDFPVGDLNQYATREDLATAMGGTTMLNSNLNLWTFKETRIGEVIIANKGVNTVLGFGIVEEPYVYIDEEPEFKHRLKVKWIANKEWTYISNTIPEYISIFRPDTYTKCKVGKEIASLYLQAYPEYIPEFKKYGMEILPATLQPKTTITAMSEIHPLNQILYGPPGTGKTYNTTSIAFEIVNKKKPLDYPEARNFFKNELQQEEKQRRIEFITFHQNYSYEDFLIGIRPNIEDNSTLGFRRNEGIFFKICDRARENWLKSQTEKIYVPSFEEVYDEFFNELIEKGTTVSIQMKDPKYKFTLTFKDENTLIITNTEGNSNNNIVKSTLKGLYEGTRSIKGGMISYYTPLVEVLRAKAKEMSSKTAQVDRENFVIIIDEINRANISRVFGELITLIEEDKRLGRPHHLKLQLPNGEYFDVPENLYIVGTMNTADKSISLIDIALRRRFEFIGYYPDYEVLEEKYEQHIELLKAINKEVYEKKKTADYLIGHAYFMNDNATENILIRKVIPLLMEYFSGKTEEVKSIFKNTQYNVTYDDVFYRWRVVAKTGINATA